MSAERIDVSAAMRGLKDFQRRTTDYVFKRMYLDASPAQRFLVADEVGLFALKQQADLRHPHGTIFCGMILA